MMPDTGHSMETKHIPIFINCRDRLSCLLMLVRWLEAAGYEQIHLIDNASTYPPLLEYYEQTPHNVVRLRENTGHLAPWTSGTIDRLAQGPYVVSDPDVVPTESCPYDAAGRMLELLERYPDYYKVGLGLAMDDIPSTYELAEWVVKWEAQHWEKEVEPGVYDAPVDTTFALYRPGS